MSRASSPSSGRRYGTARVCQLWEVPRSTVYARRARASRPAQPAAKRGPKGAGTDAALTEQIRAVLARSPFIGEGYRKAWARLRLAGVRTSKGRVLRLMRAAGLLAPTRVGRRRGPQNHDGTITTDRPDELWGTDATACLTTREGQRHGLHRRRPLHAAVRRHPRGSPRHALRGARAAPPGAAGAPRRLRAGRRRRAQPAPRPRQPVPQRPLPGRAALPRHPLEPVVRGRTRGQRLRRALHPHAQGTRPPAPSVLCRRCRRVMSLEGWRERERVPTGHIRLGRQPGTRPPAPTRALVARRVMSPHQTPGAWVWAGDPLVARRGGHVRVRVQRGEGAAPRTRLAITTMVRLPRRGDARGACRSARGVRVRSQGDRESDARSRSHRHALGRRAG